MILKENRLWSLNVYKTNEIIILFDPGPENFSGLGSKNNSPRPKWRTGFIYKTNEIINLLTPVPRIKHLKSMVLSIKPMK